jgi:hypothetical protein
MRWQVIKNRVLLWLRKILLYTIFSVFSISILSFLILQIPSVQQSLINRYLGKFSKITDFEISIKSFHLVWYDRLTLEGLKVIDPGKNTLIDAGKMKVNFSFFSLTKNGNVNIDGIELDKAAVNLTKITDTDSSRDLNINVFIDRINKMTSTGKGGPSSAKVNIGEIVIFDSRFIYNDNDRDSIPHGFDYYHFNLTLPEIQAQSFKVIGDTIQFNVDDLGAIDEKTKFEVKQLTTFFRISQGGMEFLNLNLQAGSSIITDTLIFKFKSTLDLSDFNTKVNIDGRFKNTVIHPEDLALFAPQVSVLKYPIHLEGNVKGKVNRFSYRNMQLKMGNTSLTGRLDMDGLPVINETFIDLSLKQSTININDISFAFPEYVFSQIKQLGTFQLRGNFTGFANDFVANGNFENRLGKITSDINLKIHDENVEKSVYEGNLQLIDFNLGEFLKDTATYQYVSLKGRINGKGLSEKTADFKLDGSIYSVGINGYNYKNITTNARFASSLFNGKLNIDDPNLQFMVNGSINFRKGQEQINIAAEIDTANLQALGLIKDRLLFKSNVAINTHGLQIDSIVGNAIFKDVWVNYKKDTLQVDSIGLISSLDEQIRKLSLQSSLADIQLEGNYSYTSLFTDMKNIFHEFYINIINDKKEIQEYYSNKRKMILPYEAKFFITLHDINPLIKLVNLDGSVAKGTKIEGSFSNGLTSIFKAYTKIDTAQIMNHVFYMTEIEFDGSKIRDSTTALASLTINSEQQLLAKSIKTKNLLLEGIWNKDHIDINLDLDQQNIDNQLRLKSEIDFLNDSTKIKILPSRIHLLEKDWLVNQSNYTLVNGKEWSIHHLEFDHDNESVRLDGLISDQPDPVLNLNISNLNIDIINNFTTEKFGGILNGKLAARDLYDNAFIQNDVTLKEFTVNEFLIGDITGINKWDASEKKFNISLYIDRLGQRTADVNGYYDPSQNTDPLQLKAQFDKVNLKIIEPVLKDIFTHMDGTLTGSYDVTGTFGAPKIKGEGKIEEGKIMINYLKTLYSFTGTLAMTANQIIIKDFDLIDEFSNKGNLDGYVAHRNFNTFRINLDGSFRNFQVLNTSAKDNDLFYGEAYATGNLNIFGPTTNLKISATARTGKNTRLYIPISGASSVDKKDFITFVNFRDTIIAKALSEKIAKRSEPSGITLDLNVDITPDAYAEIIFDIKAGDIIRGRGNGDIKLQLDTKGEFNMFGVFEFTEGAYNFTLYDIINKEFSIRPGGRISWYGDPYQGQMNITASYRQLASFAPIVPDQSPTVISSPGLKRKYAAEVLLKLEGAILSPQINFDIDAKDLPTNIAVENSSPVNLFLAFNAFKARLDEQELKRQVFSLIVLRRFSPPNDFNTSGSLYNSVSEFLSNQLSYWLTQVDQNLEIDLDLGTLDQEAFNTFQLRMSYSLLGGRLRITRDGTFNSQYSQSSSSTLVGDWTVDYLLTPDGKFKVKMYSRSNYNTINTSLGTQNPITTGVSLMYTQNFNEIKDLLRSARERRRRELEEKKAEEKEGGGFPEEDDGSH